MASELGAGIIELDSAFGKEIGFTSKRFTSASYLVYTDNYIWLSVIVSKQPGRGHFRELVRKIEDKGYKVKVPTPSTHLRAILQMLGFKGYVDFGRHGRVEVWQRPNGMGGR